MLAFQDGGTVCGVCDRHELILPRDPSEHSRRSGVRFISRDFVDTGTTNPGQWEPSSIAICRPGSSLWLRGQLIGDSTPQLALGRGAWTSSKPPLNSRGMSRSYLTHRTRKDCCPNTTLPARGLQFHTDWGYKTAERW